MRQGMGIWALSIKYYMTIWCIGTCSPDPEEIESLPLRASDDECSGSKNVRRHGRT